MLVGGLVGAPLGVLFLKGADPRLVRATLGVVLVAYLIVRHAAGLAPDAAAREAGRESDGISRTSVFADC